MKALCFTPTLLAGMWPRAASPRDLETTWIMPSEVWTCADAPGQVSNLIFPPCVPGGLFSSLFASLISSHHSSFCRFGTACSSSYSNQEIRPALLPTSTLTSLTVIWSGRLLSLSLFISSHLLSHREVYTYSTGITIARLSTSTQTACASH